jgi:hypothetical protein
LKPDDIATTELSHDVGEDLAAAALVAMVASSSAKQLTAID